MSGNRAVVYKGPMHVAIEDIGYPKLEHDGKPLHHGVILKVLATNICGSDMHMYRGRTDFLPGSAFGHEITGQIIEKGCDVENLEIGDIVSVPFNVACGRCRNCKERNTAACLNTNPLKAGGAYGFAEMGPWRGGQADYVLVPYADFNLLKFRDKELAMDKLEDLAMLSDIFPTGFHGAVTAGVGVGSTVYIAGAGPVGLCAAVSSYLLGAACVIIGDTNVERLNHAQSSLGCETINLNKHDVIRDQIAEIVGIPEVDCAIDAIGYECHGHGHTSHKDVVTDAMDTAIEVTRPTGGIGVPGVYLPIDPNAKTAEAKVGRIPFEFGRAWDKGLSIYTGQAPVMKYNRQLMTAILFDRVKLSRVLNTTIIPLEDAPGAYKEFESGVPQKFVLDPHGVLRKSNQARQREVAILH